MPELAISDLDETTTQVGPHWEALRHGHVFLTGGSGFIGTWLLETFLRANSVLELEARATVLTRDPDRFRSIAPHLAKHASVRLFQGDVLSADFPRGGFSHLIHAAADASRSSAEDERQRAFDTIVSGTRRVLDFCRVSGIPNLLFLSSGAVYGPQPQTLPVLAENCPTVRRTSDPASFYSEGKREAESLCEAHGEKSLSRVSIARCFAFLGPNLPLDGPFAAGNFVRDAIRGESITVRGDGQTVRSYLYAGDLAAWLWTMLLSPQASGVYNVGSDRPVTIAQLAKLIASAAGVPVCFAAARIGPTSRYVPCIDRARNNLKLDVRVSLEEAIRRTLGWYSRKPLTGAYNE
jgi:dTDP-glucose 4,6-dehydratase